MWINGPCIYLLHNLRKPLLNVIWNPIVSKAIWYSLSVFFIPKTFKLFGLPNIWRWAYLMGLPTIFSVVRVVQTFCVVISMSSFVFPFSFDHWIVCPSNYDFWLHFGMFKLFCRWARIRQSSVGKCLLEVVLCDLHLSARVGK